MSKEIIDKFQSDVEELIEHLGHPGDTFHVDIVRQSNVLIEQALRFNKREQLSRMKTSIMDYASSNSDSGPYNVCYHLFKIVRKYPKAFSDEDALFFAQLVEQSFYRKCTMAIKSQEGYSSEIHEMTEELTRYYHKIGYREKVLEILNACVDYFELCSIGMPAMRVAILCHKLVNLSSDVACTEISERVSIIMEKNGPKIKSEMAPFSASFSIPSENIDNVYRACSSSSDPGVNYFTLGLSFVPMDSTIQHAYDISIQSTSIANEFTQIRFGTNGNIASIAHPDDSSENLKKVLSYMMTTELISPVIHIVINRCIQEGVINEAAVLDYLSSSPLLDANRLVILQRGVNAYLDNDYIASISIFIPQLEEMIRKMYSILGYSVTTSDSTKTESDTLGRLLKKTPVIIGERNISGYLDLILSDTRGWNLRNLFCHGLTEAFNWKNADRLFQILMLLAGLRFVPIDNS